MNILEEYQKAQAMILFYQRENEKLKKNQKKTYTFDCCPICHNGGYCDEEHSTCTIEISSEEDVIEKMEDLAFKILANGGYLDSSDQGNLKVYTFTRKSRGNWTFIETDINPDCMKDLCYYDFDFLKVLRDLMNCILTDDGYHETPEGNRSILLDGETINFIEEMSSGEYITIIDPISLEKDLKIVSTYS